MQDNRGGNIRTHPTWMRGNLNSSSENAFDPILQKQSLGSESIYVGNSTEVVWTVMKEDRAS